MKETTFIKTLHLENLQVDQRIFQYIVKLKKTWNIKTLIIKNCNSITDNGFLLYLDSEQSKTLE